MNPILNGSVQAKAFLLDLEIVLLVGGGLIWLVTEIVRGLVRRSRRSITRRCWR